MSRIYKSLILITMALLEACSGSSDSNAKQSNQKVSVEQALQSFSVDQQFWRSVKKSEFDGKRIISLIHSMDSPTAPITTELMAYDLEGKPSSLQKLPYGYSVVDFDVTPN